MSKRFRIWTGIAVVLLAVAVACYVAARMYSAGLAACAEGGEDVRTALATFHQMHGKYPAQLAELPSLAAPAARACVAWSHLSYRLNEGTYRLQYEDLLTGWVATEKEPFQAYML